MRRHLFVIFLFVAQIVFGQNPDYLRFTAVDGPATIKLTREGNPPSISLQYSTDGTTWSSYSIDQVISLPSGGIVYFRATNSNYRISSLYSSYYYFVMTGRVAASGNITSLTDNTMTSNVARSYAYCGLFKGCTSLISAPELPATILNEGCYFYMFDGCTSLTTAPALPANTLAERCYEYMFHDCSSLISPPALPATSIPARSYANMFQGCSHLVTAPALPATTLSSHCYYEMFFECSGLTEAPDLPATTLSFDCYFEMFKGCSGLTTPPQLPATTLSIQCYWGMFQGCSGLTTAPTLPATTLSSSCYYSMFEGCSALTTPPQLPAATLTEQCYRDMFKGCSGLTTAPTLAATALATSCYCNMFEGCTALTTPPRLPATTLTEQCYLRMFKGCSGLTSIPNLPATTLANSCYYEMFKDCSNVRVNFSGPGNIWKIPSAAASSAASSSNWGRNMFSGTGGTLTGQPVVGQDYYVSWNTTPQVTISVNIDGSGVVTGSGNYYVGDWVTLTAVPSSGYLFSHWNNGDTASGIFFTATRDSVFTAYFVSNTPSHGHGVALPYCENFDSYRPEEGVLPLYWKGYNTLAMDLGRYPILTSEYSVSPNNSFALHLMGSNLCYAVLPEFTIDSIQQINLSFMARVKPTEQGMLIIGVLPDTNNFRSFEPIDTIYPPSDRWEQINYSFRNYHGSSKRVALLDTILPGYSFGNIYLDNFMVTVGSAPSIELINNNIVRVALEEDAVADYWIEYGLQGFAPDHDSSTLVHVTTSPFYVTGLAPESSYDFYSYSKIDSTTAIRATCNNPTTITTLPKCIVTDTLVLSIPRSGLPYIFGRDTIRAAGTYTYSFVTASGCDSLLTVILNHNCSTYSDTTATACDSFEWHQTTYRTSTDSATFTTQNIIGCDSIITLHLTIHHSDSVSINIASCDSYTWDVDNKTYTHDTTLNTIISNHLGCDSILTLHLTILPSPVLHHIPDTVLFVGQSLTLHASGSDMYTWYDINDNVLSNDSLLTVTPNTTTKYILSAFNQGRNLVYNGEFELGNIGFSTSYSYSSSLGPEGRYMIGTNAQSYHGGFTGAHDHTSGSGNYMIVNGAPGVGIILWTQLVSVQPHTNYAFSVWGTNVSPYSQNYMAKLQFSINGTQIGDIFQLPTPLNTWTQFYEIWDSDTNTLAEITILNQNTLSAGNDFGIDDIYFSNLTTCRTNDTIQVFVGQHIDSVVCDNHFPIVWNGKRFDAPGAKSVTLTDRWGNDSIVVMNVRSIPSTYKEYAQTVCDSFLWNGVVYTESDTMTYTTINSVGCDSTVTLHLTVNYSSASTLDSTIVENSLPLTWNGVVFTCQDTFQTHLQNSVACDSLVTMRLRVHPNVTGEDDSTICLNQLPITWNGVVFDSTDLSQPLSLRQQVVKSTTLISSTGSDSLLTLTLYVNPSFDLHISDTLCNNHFPYTWEDTTFFAQDQIREISYRYATHTSLGCDSLRTLHLTILDTTTGDTTAVVCDSLNWWGSPFFASAEPTHLLTNSVGCDSTVTLHLTVNHSSASTLDSTIVENSLPLTWNGVMFTCQDTLQTHLQNSVGCDSLVTMRLRVHPNVSGEDDSTICLNQLPITWNGVVFDSADLTQPLTLRQQVVKSTTLISSTGSDSLLTLTLYVNPSFDLHISDTLCNNHFPYTWEDTTFLSHNQLHEINYRYSTQSSFGCDSLRTLHLTVLDTTMGDTTAVACDSLNWWGTPFFASAEPTHLLTNSVGCDSTVTLHLTVNHSSASTLDSTIVENSLPITWNGVLFSCQDTLQTHLQNSVGCDSLVTMRLKVHPNVTGEDDTTLCLNRLPITWNGVTFDSADLTQPLSLRQQIVKSTTLISSTGSDSLLTLTLYVTPSFDLHISDTLCNNHFPYTWEDTTFLAQDQIREISYRYATQSSFGCDSLRTLHLTILDTTVSSFSDTIVENALPYTFNGLTFNQSVADSIVVIANSMGCDSVIHFSLTVHLNVGTNIDSTVCLNRLPITWNGVVFDSADFNTHLPSDVPLCVTKNRILTSYTGSDSTVVMTLTVNPSYNFHLFDTICSNQLPYHWGSHVFDTEGSQTILGQSLLGCDSITHYTLTVFDTVATIDSVVQCQPFLWIDGRTYIRDTVGPQFTLQTHYGCDSVATLSFHISHPSYTLIEDSLCRGNTYLFNGRMLTSGGIYYDTVLNIEGCDSIIQLTLRELLPHEITFDVGYNCEDRSYTLTANTDARYVLWTSIALSDEVETQEHQREIIVHPFAPTVYSLYADYSEDPFCPSSEDLSLEPLVKPVAQIEAKPSYLSSESIELVAIDRSISSTRREWYINGEQRGSETSITYAANLDEDSVIVVLVASNSTCSDTDEVVVPIIHTDLYVPNVFTPGLTTNNTFSIVGKEIYQCELQIYNREGLLVFSSSESDTPWDGTRQGVPCAQGTYIYRFHYTLTCRPDAWHTLVGSVTLIR